MDAACKMCSRSRVVVICTLITAVFSTVGGCTITDFGAVSGNHSSDARKNTDALQLALATCELVHVPAGVFKLLPITLPSHRILFLDAGAMLVGSESWQNYGVTDFLPPMGTQQQLRPLLSATNATNVTITGLNGTIDGNGWFAWPATNWSSPECGERRHCVSDIFFGAGLVPPQRLRPPHVLTFVGCTGVTLRNITVLNPPFWGVQHFWCNESIVEHVTILAPRWTRQIAGFMPWSVLDYRVSDSYVHVGDDAVAIMSGADASGVLRPSSRLVFQRLFVRGRSVAIGSADVGNVTDVLFEDCTIGDDEGSSPWAFKIKMHANRAHHVSRVAFRNLRLGNITSNTWQDPDLGVNAGVALFMGMNYGGAKIDPGLPQPSISNISFVNVSAAGTYAAGQITGISNSLLQGLHFERCDFASSSPAPWQVSGVNLTSCSSVKTQPAFPI
eukprot:g893.t1